MKIFKYYLLYIGYGVGKMGYDLREDIRDKLNEFGLSNIKKILDRNVYAGYFLMFYDDNYVILNLYVLPSKNPKYKVKLGVTKFLEYGEDIEERIKKILDNKWTMGFSVESEKMLDLICSMGGSIDFSHRYPIYKYKKYKGNDRNYLLFV